MQEGPIMRSTPNFVFHGDQRRPKHPHLRAPQQPEPYVALPDLIEAVNLAIYFQHPLLVEGEAGCGKTRLAYAVAYELGLPLIRWNVRSTSRVQEGLYTYDYILRLHDAQLARDRTQPQSITTEASESPSKPRDPHRWEDYLTYGPLGNAFQMEDAPAVVLIDEIDKADRDFPNDLLGILDEWAFEIREADRPVRALETTRPIVIITSNKEKGDLPDPFLRRCIYHFIDFPDDERLKEIVAAHFTEGRGLAPKLKEQAIARFLELRRDGGLQKKPGTSELLNWLEALHTLQPTRTELAQDRLEYPGLLLKLRADWQRHRAPR